MIECFQRCVLHIRSGQCSCCTGLGFAAMYCYYFMVIHEGFMHCISAYVMYCTTKQMCMINYTFIFAIRKQ